MGFVRVPITDLKAGERVLDGEAARYLTRVHRLRNGDGFVGFDPVAATEANGALLSIERERVRVSFDEPRPGIRAELAVRLWQCVGKGEKPDDVVRAATALGAAQIVFCESERTVVKLGARGEQRRERWREIALSAMSQCGRADVPEISGPISLSLLLSGFDSERTVGVLLHPEAERELGAVLATGSEKPLILLVGPEGGLTREEVAEVRSAGFVPARFGSFALRTELAAIAALGAVLAFRANHTRG